MISPHKIKFNDMESLELPVEDLILEVAFDSDSGETSTYLNRESVASETHDGRYRRVSGYKYSESFSPKFTFTKKGFTTFTMSEVREVLKWLTSTSKTAVLDVYYTHIDDANSSDWSAIGGWTEINTYKLGNNRTVAITATFEAVTPYAVSDLIEVEKDVSNPADNVITIDLKTDEPQHPVYPRITIKQKDTVVVNVSEALTEQSDMVVDTVYYDGSKYYWRPSQPTKKTSAAQPSFDWTIVEVDHAYTDEDTWENNTIYYYESANMYYWLEPYAFTESIANPNLSTTGVKLINRHGTHYADNQAALTTGVAHNSVNETIVLDGANRVVSSSHTSRIFGDDFASWNWLPLYEGENPITVIGNCEVTIEYRYPIKCGEF